MIRIVRLANEYYGMEIGELENSNCICDILDFIDSGTPVILTNDLCYLDEIGIKECEVTMVESMPEK